jgi:hypothetical protein
LLQGVNLVKLYIVIYHIMVYTGMDYRAEAQW